MKKEILELLFYVGGLALAIIATLFSDIGVFSIIHLALGVFGFGVVLVSLLDISDKCQKKYNLPNFYTYCVFFFFCICVYSAIDVINM